MLRTGVHSHWQIGLGSIKYLRELELNNNMLRSLPEDLGTLEFLQRLNLACNELTLDCSPVLLFRSL